MVKFVSLSATGYIWSDSGTGIEAGEGIKAGLSIRCKLVLKFAYRIFAGTAIWRDKDNEEAEIECGKLEGGKVCYGIVKELGLPDEKNNGKLVKIKLKGGKIVEGEIVQ